MFSEIRNEIKKNRTRERKTSFYMKTKTETENITITINTKNCTTEFLEGDPTISKSVVYYERESGKDKFLLEVPGSKNLNIFDVNTKILGQFTHMLAVDTNKYTYGESRSFAVA